MEIVQQIGFFTLFSCKFHSNIYSILFEYKSTRIIIISYLEKPLSENNNFQIEMDNSFLDKTNGTVVNQTGHSINERTLVITSTVT